MPMLRRPSVAVPISIVSDVRLVLIMREEHGKTSRRSISSLRNLRAINSQVSIHHSRQNLKS